MMPETTEAAGMPAAADAFCGDSQKSLKMAKPDSTKSKLNLIPLILKIKLSASDLCNPTPFFCTACISLSCCLFVLLK
jgi:hypothetical protein